MALIDIEGLRNGEIELKEITIDMLIADAVERGSEEGLAFLKEKYFSKNTRKGGKEVKTPISSYRKEYLEKYAGYKKKAKYNPDKAKKYFAAKKAREVERIDGLFSEAAKKLSK